MEPASAAAAPDDAGRRGVVDVTVSHNKTEHHFPALDPHTTVGQLQAMLQARAGVKPEHQKLIHKGRTLTDPDQTLARLLPPPPLPPPPSARAGLKLVLVGASAAEIDALDAAVRAAARGRGRVVDDLRLLSVGAGTRRPAAGGGLRRRQYGFGAIEVLPGLPDPERARAILEELAEDPGVLHVMATFKWSVGALCELYPEGYVGVSDVCVMGLNQNKGQKILLRLRTDDLRGWRKILSIKKVLYHELAHNEHGDHDDDFYRLMRKIEKEVVAFNNSGRSLGGGAGGLLMPQADTGRGRGFVGGSGRLGGESAALTGVLSAREMAGLAAAQRKTAEEQEIEDACPSGRGTGVGEGVVVHARPRDAASPVVEVGWRASEVVEVTVDEEEGSSMEVVEVGHGDGDGDGEGHSPASCRGGRHEEHEPAPVAAAPPLETPATVPSSAAMPPPSTAVPPPPLDAASSPPARAPAPAPAAMPEAAASVDEGAVEQLLDLGFARAAIVAALGRAGGDVERAVNLLVAAGGVVEAAPAAPGVVEGEDEEVPLDLTTREGRAVAAARRLVREETRGDEPGRVAALSTLKLMLQAVLDHPGEAKYRRVRLGNAKFQRAVGRFPAALVLLRAVGFEERVTPEGEAVMELGRDDAGLLWLGKSALEAEEARVDVGARG